MPISRQVSKMPSRPYLSDNGLALLDESSGYKCQCEGSNTTTRELALQYARSAQDQEIERLEITLAHAEVLCVRFKRRLDAILKA